MSKIITYGKESATEHKKKIAMLLGLAIAAELVILTDGLAAWMEAVLRTMLPSGWCSPFPRFMYFGHPAFWVFVLFIKESPRFIFRIGLSLD